MKLPLKLVKPDAENRAVVPTRLANSKYRSREHLTPSEVEKLTEAAKTKLAGAGCGIPPHSGQAPRLARRMSWLINFGR